MTSGQISPQGTGPQVPGDRRRGAGFGPLITTLVALGLAISVVTAGCEEDDDDPIVGTPQLIVSADFQCSLGDNYLPVTTRDEIQRQDLITAVVSIEGTAPSAEGTNMVDGTSIDLYVADVAGNRVTAAGSFVSSPSPVEAVSQGLYLVSGRVKDEFYCLQPGVFYLFASTEIYTDSEGNPLSSARGYPVRCVSRDEWRCQCNDDCGDASMDAFVDPDLDMGVTDAGDMGPDASLPPWTMAYESPPAADLEVGIRGSFREGRGDNITLTYRISDDSGLAPDEPVTVTFTLAPDSPRDIQLQPMTATTDASGLAQVRLIAGVTPGVTAVVATATWRGRTETRTSPTISIRGGIPSYRGFTFLCDEQVIPAFESRVQNSWPMALVPDAAQCTVQLSDRLGGVIDEPTQVFYLAEAGTVDQAVITTDEGLSTTSFRISEPSPDDIAPQQLFNPEDGIATLVAITRGEEQFTDNNANGIYDPGEPLIDLPEPFVDANDNGVQDLGELYRDTNGDGVWNPANGQWDNNIEIWRSTRILLTGKLSNVTSGVDIECPVGRCSQVNEFNVLCPQGLDYYFSDLGAMNMTLRALDDNSNCLIGAEISVETDINDLQIVPSIAASVDITREQCFRNGQPQGAIFDFSIVDTERMEPTDEPNFGEIQITVDYPLAEGGQGTATYLYSVCVP